MNLDTLGHGPGPERGAGGPVAIPPASLSASLPLDDRSLFTPWTDPATGVTSYLLTARAAPLQQSFYFVNPSMTEDGRYYWFYCVFPPSNSKYLGVVDFARRRIRCFPETGFISASPLVDRQSGRVYWSNENGIWTRGPGDDEPPRLVNGFSPELVRNRKVSHYATHHTFSSDRRALNIDAKIGSDWYIGSAPLDGSPIEIWQQVEGCHNHVQFSPSDPDLMLVAQDYHSDPSTGQVTPYANRLWLARRGQGLAAVYPHGIEEEYERMATTGHIAGEVPQRVTDRRAMQGHEWWNASGSHIWYIQYGGGVERIGVGATVPERAWPHRSVSHAHADAAERYLVLDALPGDDPTDRRVSFLNRASGRQIDIVSFLPDPPAEWFRYHIHPHPQFCLRDRMICYTTTVAGTMDVAFVPVSALVEATT